MNTYLTLFGVSLLPSIEEDVRSDYEILKNIIVKVVPQYVYTETQRNFLAQTICRSVSLLSLVGISAWTLLKF